ncbi:MAG: hypothetical protein J0J01_07470 [Reyranella sp.]|nr:hypothetical protein [Reyranella sp.]
MDGTTDVGVPHAHELVAFAEAAIERETKPLNAARVALVRSLGEKAVVDAAAVIAGFDGITRIADATGIPLEPPKAAQTADLRAALRIDEFDAAKW